MKRRLIAAGICFVFLLLLSIACAGNLDFLLTQGQTACTLQPVLLLKQILATPRALLLTLLFAAAGLLFVLWGLFGNSYLNYRSNMYEVVPGFKIPRPAGQGQFGTAWWLDPREYSKCFATAEAPLALPLNQDLAQYYEQERSRIKDAQM